MKIVARAALVLALMTVTIAWPQDLTTPAAEAASPASEPPLEPPLEPIAMLRLRDGSILWGSIAGHSQTGIEFLRLDTSGRSELPWAFIDPKQEGELRLRFGYVDSQAAEIMTDADRIPLADGGEMIGKIVNRDDAFLYVKRSSGIEPVPRKTVAGEIVLTQVPALDLYTKEELYQEKTFALQERLLAEGEEGAAAHAELAAFAERLFAFAHAVKHYEEAQARAPGFQAAEIKAALARAALKAARQGEVDELAEIDLLRARRNFAKAVELLNAFPNLHPNSPLLEDWNKLRERIIRDQERALREQVVIRWHRAVVDRARAVARGSSFEAALSYLDEQMGEDVLKSVHESLKKIAPEITPEQVKKLWSERKGGRYRRASYGLGTWLLGAEGAVKDLGAEPSEEEERAAAPASGSQGEARKKLEEKIKRYLKNQEISKRAKVDAASEEDPEAFWKDYEFASRAQWMLAHYAENSGDFQDLQDRQEYCRECGGVGVREVVFTGSAVQGAVSGEGSFVCATCHGVKVVRRVRYR